MILRMIGPLYRGSQKVEHGIGHRNYLLEENINFSRNIKRVPPLEMADVEDSAYFDGKTTLEALNRLNQLSKNQKPFS